MQSYIPVPPQDIFSVPRKVEGISSTPESVFQEHPYTYEIEHIEINNGIYIHYKGIKYPRKGFPFPEAVAEVNKVKRLFMDILKLVTKPYMLISWGLLLVLPSRVKSIESILNIINKCTYPIVSKYLVKPELMTPLASEFQALLGGTLMNLGISTDISTQFALVVGSIFEYDNAYRYRLQDLFSETNKELLVRFPYLETKRLFILYLTREKIPVVRQKFSRFYRILTIPLLIPSIHSAVIKALYNCDFKRLQYDENDIYWCRIRKDDDYNYFGMNREERMKGYSEPTTYEVKLI